MVTIFYLNYKKRKGMIQMSKIYDKYINLKTNDNTTNTLYLFKYGIFFIFVDNDAKIASNLLHLKLSNLNDSVVKCGFPVNSLSKYISLLNNTQYNIQIVNMSSDKPISTTDYIFFESLKDIFNEIISLNIDSLSISQAYDFLYNMQSKLIDINKEYNIEKAK